MSNEIEKEIDEYIDTGIFRNPEIAKPYLMDGYKLGYEKAITALKESHEERQKRINELMDENQELYKYVEKNVDLKESHKKQMEKYKNQSIVKDKLLEEGYSKYEQIIRAEVEAEKEKQIDDIFTELEKRIEKVMTDKNGTESHFYIVKATMKDYLEEIKGE